MTAKDETNKLFQKVNTFMITCIDEDGFPLTKAVVPAKHRDCVEEIYFCTNTSSNFAANIARNLKACVYFYSRKLVWKGCLLKGTMEIVTDPNVKEEYWQNKFKNAYKEKSFTDPDFCLLKFTAISGRFYSWYKPEDFTFARL